MANLTAAQVNELVCQALDGITAELVDEFITDKGFTPDQLFCDVLTHQQTIIWLKEKQIAPFDVEIPPLAEDGSNKAHVAITAHRVQDRRLYEPVVTGFKAMVLLRLK